MSNPLQSIEDGIRYGLEQAEREVDRGYDEACQGVEAAGRDLDEGYHAVQHGLEEAREAAARTYEVLLENAERAIITSVTAPSHRASSDQKTQAFKAAKHSLASKFAEQWDSYADNFDSAASGQWVTKARQTIKAQAEQLRHI